MQQGAFVVRIERSVSSAAASPSPRVLRVAAMFGLGIDQQRDLAIVPQCEIPISFPRIIFVTGPSGGGKSTILAMLETELKSRGVRVLRMTHTSPNLDCKSTMQNLNAVRDIANSRVDIAREGSPRQSAAHCTIEATDADNRPLIDQIGATLEQGLSIFARVGLSDAFAMLRRRGELSDGQRARFAMAQVIEAAEQAMQRGERIAIIADEFAATLDRTMAMTIARNLRKWVSGNGGDGHRGESTGNCAKPGVCLIVATTHDDLLEALRPDVLVYKGLGDEIEVVER